LLAQRLIDRVEGVALRGEHLMQRFREVLQQVKAICHLGGRGCTLASALGIRARPIPRNDLHPWVLPQPLCDRLGGPLREQGHGLPALQVHQDRAIGVPFAQGEIVHPQHPGCGQSRKRQLPEQAQQGVPAHRQGKLLAEVHPRLATQGEPHSNQTLGQPQRAPRPGGGDRGQPFSEDATAAVTIAAKPLAHAQLEAHAIRRPGQIRQGAFVVTVDMLRGGGAQRTQRRGLGREHAKGELRRGGIDLTRLEAQRGGIR